MTEQTDKRTPAFWNWFDGEIHGKLERRAATFRKAFGYLDTFREPVLIVETGCARTQGNWGGDGQSTLLFAKYIEARNDGSQVVAMDIDPNATALAKKLTDGKVEVLTGDSVPLLSKLERSIIAAQRKISLLYLDSFDVDFQAPLPSAIHHLYELLAIKGALGPRTLVMVDDAPMEMLGVPNANQQLEAIQPPRIGGKAKFVAEYAQRLGIQPALIGYQVGWVGLY
jgi:predicted O-methyltransferase YrrM